MIMIMHNGAAIMGTGHEIVTNLFDNKEDESEQERIFSLRRPI